MIGRSRSLGRIARSALDRRTFALGAASAVAGCGGGRERLNLSAISGGEAATPPVELTGLRFWADAEIATWTRQLVGDRPPRGAQILAISGGAEDGAYGAGVLNGWSARGDRPAFDLVTGVSTGTFIAPFAFLGPSRDRALEEIYTSYDSDDVVRSRGLRGVLGEALYDTAPLERLLARYVDAPLMAAVAREHAAGRRLFVVTTNLDADRPVVWNMGRVASLPVAQGLPLFRAVLLASASLPGVFPAVLIRGRDGGAPTEELHVDGGTNMQFLAVPEALLRAGAPRSPATPLGAPPTIHILVNNRLTPVAETVETSALSVLERSVSSFIRSNARAGVVSTIGFARANGADIRLAAVGADFDRVIEERFDQDYMTALFAYGRAQAAAGEAWRLAADGGADALLRPAA